MVKISAKSQVHLWIYNHPFHGISDQVDFFISALKQHGYIVSVGRQPSNSSLNVVIENFCSETSHELTQFCQSTRKKVAVIMTEHIDFDEEEIFIHGQQLWNKNDYMHPATQVARLRYLMECIPYIRCFFVLGDLPELRNMSSMLPGINVHTIPFPSLEPVSFDNRDNKRNISNDLLFTGAKTEYRSSIYSVLQKDGVSITWPNKFISRRKRNKLSSSSKIILNIPQRADWHWISLMRVIAALRSGRATVSLGTEDQSRIASCCVQMDMNEEQWPELLKERIKDWQTSYHQSYENYMTMAEDFERKHGFPHVLLEYWATTDGLS